MNTCDLVIIGGGSAGMAAAIGAYKKGTNPALDEAVSKINYMNGFLTQGINESFSYEETVRLMRTIAG